MVFREISRPALPFAFALDVRCDDVVGQPVYSFSSMKPFGIIRIARQFATTFWSIDPNSHDSRDWTPWGDYNGSHPIPPQNPIRDAEGNKPKPTPPRPPHNRYDDHGRLRDDSYDYGG